MSIIVASYSPPDGTRVVAFTHPGHMGDLLWTIPAARELAQRHGCKADYWTSKVCEPCADLLQVQEFIRHVVVDPNQRVEGGGGGVQPWHMANADGPGNGYEAVYHFGIRSEISMPIPEYYCRMYGLPQLPNRYDLPPDYWGRSLPNGPFVVKASKGDGYFSFFREFVQRCPYPVVEVGGIGQAIAADVGAIDRTGKGFLEMTWIISRCKWFIGQMSSPLVLASGFDCRKICICSPGQGDMRHVVQTPMHHYVGPDVNQVLELIR